jgi:hypothetical protein
MKKVLGFLVVILAVVIAGGAVQTKAYDFSLLGVDIANKIWILDSRKDEKNITPVARNWKPASMLLLGMSLVGVSAYARKRFKTD